MSMPPPIPSAAQRLTEELTAFAEQVDAFLDASTINYRPAPSDVTVFGWHPHRWGKLDDHGRRLQRALLEAWPPLMERLRLLLSADPSQTQKQLDKLTKFVSGWLDQPGTSDRSVPATIPQAQERFAKEFSLCFDLLTSLGQETGATLVVPDSNVLVRSPDLGGYRRVLGTDDYTVVLVAPVLTELDTLKTGRISPSVREKARVQQSDQGLASPRASASRRQGRG